MENSSKLTDSNRISDGMMDNTNDGQNLSIAHLNCEELIAELAVVRERLAELEDLEVQRITEEQERFDSLNVLDEYAQQLEESRDKLARLLQAGVAIEEVRTTHAILQTAANAIGAAGWASAVVYLFDNFEVIESAYFGVCDEDIAELEKNRRPADERARMFSPEFDDFKVSRSYFVPAQRLHEVIHSRYVVPGRRESLPGDDWDPMDLVYVPMYSSTGKVLGTINCDDPVNGKRPTAEVFQYLEIFADLAARKIETVQLLNRQAEIESQLRESEKKYRTIFDRSADGFFLMDDLFRECNDAALRLFGCEHDDIIGHAPSEFSPKFQPDGQRSDKLAAEYISRARAGIPQNFEWLHVRKDGALLNCEVSLASIEVSGRSMIMAIVRDVSERKRMAHDKETTAISSQLFLSARSMDLVYSQLPKILITRFPFEIAAIELYDPVTDECILAGETNSGLPLGFRVPANLTISGTVIRSGEPVTDAQASRRPDYAHADLRRMGLQKVVCVPLRVRDTVIGVLWLGDSQFVTSIDQALEELNQQIIPLNVIANYLAQAIDRQRAEEEILDLKQFFENLLDNLPAQIAVYDQHGNYRYTNRANVPDPAIRDWLIGRNDEELVHRLNIDPEIGRNRAAALSRVLAEGGQVSFEETARDIYDRERYYLKAVSPVTNLSGQIEYIVGFGQDITDTKLWEQEQRLLRLLPTDNPFPVLACSSDGTVHYMNAAAEALMKRSCREHIADVLPEDHMDIVADIVKGESNSEERHRQLGSTSVQWIYCKSASGQIGIYGSVVPREAGTLSNGEKQQLQQLQMLSEGMTFPVWLLDGSGAVIASSAAAKRMLIEHGQDHVRQLIDPELFASFMSLRQDLQVQQVAESQVNSRSLIWTYTAISDNLNLLEVRDMTELRQLQDKLRHAQKLEAVGRLAGGIAHDFNNLLTGIIGNLELLEQSSCTTDGGRDFAREAARAAERASNLVKQLLSYSRKSTDQPIALDPNLICSNVVRMLSRTVDRRISVIDEGNPNIWPIAANVNQLEQILMNLGVNAADAIVEKLGSSSMADELPFIRIRTENVTAHLLRLAEGKRVTRDCVMISVIDNGCGMTPQVQKRIFDAFFTTKSEHRGTGLGLSIVAELVEDLGGEIQVSSAEGKGSVFKILLPRSASPAASPPVERAFGNVRGGNETILLVDDEPVIIDLGKEVLESAGYSVIVATDGREAVSIFCENKNQIDLVIMDISLPVISGDEAVALILEEKESTPIILSSGLPDASAERRRISLGSVAFIQKPYRPSELLGSVREVLDHLAQ